MDGARLLTVAYLSFQVPVWAVLDYTNTKLVERELLLVKTSILGPEMLHRQLPDTYHDEHEDHAELDENSDEEVRIR
jgi:acetolactate synthase-1/3 small subunit